MLRGILAVIVGYVVMALCVVAAFTGMFLVLGTEGSFRPGSWEASTRWVLLSIPVGLAAAWVGGFTCRAIARGQKPVLWLVVLILVAGFASGWMTLRRPDPGPRAGEVSNAEAAAKAITPTWLVLLNPVIGALGVTLGARRKRPIQA